MSLRRKFQAFAVVCLSFLLCLLVAAGAFAEALRKVRVGFFRFPGYHEIAADGRYSGYGYDVLQMLRFYNNWEYEYVGYDKSWDEMLRMLEHGEIDLLTSARRTTEREQKFEISSMPIGIKATRLSVRDDDTRYVTDAFATYNGMRVGSIRGSSQNEVFRDFAAEHGFSYTLVPFANTEQMERALKVDRYVDAVLTSNVRHIEGERVLNQFADRPFYVLARKGDKQLMAQVDAALEQINEASPLWFNELWYEHYNYAPNGGHGDKLRLSAAESVLQQEVADRIYTVLVGVGHAPYAYLENGEIKGVLPDIFQEVARRAKIKYRLLPVHDIKAYVECVQEGKADFVLDMPQDEFLSERTGYLLSTPYVSSTQYLVQRSRSAQASGRLAAVKLMKDDVRFKKLARNYQGVIYYDTYDECVEAVKNETCDATYLDSLQAQEVIANDRSRQLVMTQEPNTEAGFCIGVSEKLPPELRSLLNKAVISTNADYSRKVIGQYLLKAHKHSTLLDFLYDNPLAAFITLAVLMLFVSVIVVMYVRQKNLRIITRQNGQLREKQELLREALAKAELANKAKTSFLNNMSHDIRTPMNSIIGFTAVALDEAPADSPLKGYLAKIQLSGQHLLSLINDILDMSRIDSGKLQVAPVPCDLRELVQGLKVMLQGQAEEKQLTFVVDMERLHDSYVLCDKLLLQRCLVNCLSNAIKYTQSGGTVILQLTQDRTADGEADYTMRVCDNGIGMSQEFLKHIYELFERENSSTVSGIKGSGLGMAITKNMLELMGGTIAIQSEKGLGTEVVIHLTLPLTDAPQQELTQSLEQPEAFRGRHLLLVDDVPLNREIASLILQKAGFKVTMLPDGSDAVEYMRSDKAASVDAILMDLMMPGMDGFEATRRIRALPDKVAASVPIIALTASAFAENKKQALAAGMNGHIAKPISLASLTAELRKYFKEQKE